MIKKSPQLHDKLRFLQKSYSSFKSKGFLEMPWTNDQIEILLKPFQAFGNFEANPRYRIKKKIEDSPLNGDGFNCFDSSIRYIRMQLLHFLSIWWLTKINFQRRLSSDPQQNTGVVFFWGWHYSKRGSNCLKISAIEIWVEENPFMIAQKCMGQPLPLPRSCFTFFWKSMNALIAATFLLCSNRNNNKKKRLLKYKKWGKGRGTKKVTQAKPESA